MGTTVNKKSIMIIHEFEYTVHYLLSSTMASACIQSVNGLSAYCAGNRWIWTAVATLTYMYIWKLYTKKELMRYFKQENAISCTLVKIKGNQDPGDIRTKEANKVKHLRTCNVIYIFYEGKIVVGYTPIQVNNGITLCYSRKKCLVCKSLFFARQIFIF